MKKNWLISSVMSLVVGVSVFAQEKPKNPPTEYVAKDYSYLFGMPGFTDSLLKMHFQLYQGYVKNSNLLLSRLKRTRIARSRSDL